VLAPEFLYIEGLETAIWERRWLSVFSQIGAVLLVWADYLSTFALDIDVIKELSLM
jgi:hypothetical protein